jgi:hypothetical protein
VVENSFLNNGISMVIKKRKTQKKKAVLGRKSDDIYNYNKDSFLNKTVVRDFKQSYKHISECLEVAPVTDSIEFISSLISQQPYVIHGGSDEINKFVKDNLDNLSVNMIIENCLYSLIYGFNVQEIIWGLDDDNRIIIEDVVSVAQSTLDSGLLNFVYRGNNIIGFKQMTNMTYLNNSNSNSGEIFIPIEKTIYTVYKPKFGNPMGNSILRPINFEIQMFKELYENLRLFSYRLSLPLTVVTTDESNKDEVNNLVKSVKSNLEHPKGAILLKEGTTIDKVDRGSNTSKTLEYINSIDHIKDSIYSRFGISNIMRHDKYGSSAKQAVDANIVFNIMNEYVEIINKIMTDLISRLISYNFPVKDKIKFTLNEIKTVNYAGLFDILNNAGMDNKSEIYRTILDLCVLDYTDVEFTVQEDDITVPVEQSYHSVDGYNQTGDNPSEDPNGEKTKQMIKNG